MKAYIKTRLLHPSPAPAIALALLSGLGLRMALAHNMRWGSWAAAVCGLLAAATALHVLRHRPGVGAGATSGRNWKRRLCLAAAATLTLPVVFSLGVAYYAASRLVHPPRLAVACSPEERGIVHYESVSFAAADGLTLRGWYAPTRNGAAVVLMHGLNRNRCRLLAEAALLTERGYGVLLYDARNAGESEGTVTTFGVQEVDDALGAAAFVRALPGVEAGRIGLFGHSLGGATAIQAAGRLPEVGAVVAVSAFSRLEENIAAGVTTRVGLPAFPFAPLILFFGRQEAGVDIRQARPVEAVAALGGRPVLIAHGEQDDVLPVVNAYRLYAAARGPKELFIVPGMGHYCCLPPGEVETGYLQEYTARVVGFLDRHLLSEPR